MESMPMQMRPPNPMDPSMKPAQMMPPIQMHPSQMMSQMQMMQAPPAMYNQSQMVVNMNFQRNAIQSIQSIMDKH